MNEGQRATLLCINWRIENLCEPEPEASNQNTRAVPEQGSLGRIGRQPDYLVPEETQVHVQTIQATIDVVKKQ